MSVVLAFASPRRATRPREEEQVAQPERRSKLRRETGAANGQASFAGSSGSKPARPPLTRSTSSLTILTAALDIFSRRPKEFLLEEQPPFSLADHAEPVEVEVELNERRSSLRRPLPSMPSLLSLSALLHRSPSSANSETTSKAPHARPTSVPLFPGAPSCSSLLTPPTLISPTASEFSDASTLIPTPTSCSFPSAHLSRTGGSRSSEALKHLVMDCPVFEEDEVEEAEGDGWDGLGEGVASPVLYEGVWGHGVVGLAY